MQKVIIGCLSAIMLWTIGCNNKELCGPCFMAMHYRQEAEKTIPAMEKAALLGKADAAQRDCDAQNRQLRDQQKHGAKLRQR
jgi:uncharacterized lipoprotein NlpE involved in copper resistance